MYRFEPRRCWEHSLSEAARHTEHLYPVLRQIVTNSRTRSAGSRNCGRKARSTDWRKIGLRLLTSRSFLGIVLAQESLSACSRPEQLGTVHGGEEENGMPFEDTARCEEKHTKHKGHIVSNLPPKSRLPGPNPTSYTTAAARKLERRATD